MGRCSETTPRKVAVSPAPTADAPEREPGSDVITPQQCCGPLESSSSTSLGNTMYRGERFNGYSHLLGLLLATAGSAALLAKTMPDGDPAKTASALVFAISMMTLYAASTLFHSTRGRVKLFWQRMDHCAIYILIAGSYTPFALVTLQGPWGWALLAAIWSAAILGIGRELRPTEPPKTSLLLYMGMGPGTCSSSAARSATTSR
jgi:channel protein (hemolysin III family)